jgi:hypothetical protein
MSKGYIFQVIGNSDRVEKSYQRLVLISNRQHDVLDLIVLKEATDDKSWQ